MRKRMLVGPLASGLLAAMLPGVVAAEQLPDPQAKAIAGVCQAVGGTFEYEDASGPGPRENIYRCAEIINPFEYRSPRDDAMRRLCFEVIAVRGDYDNSQLAWTQDGSEIIAFSCNLSDAA